jgi:hypothetical protein
LDDLIVGAYQAHPNGNNSGKSYIVFGKANGSTKYDYNVLMLFLL